MYLDFFQLKEFPFSITPDPRYLYLSPGYRSAFEHLRYGITHRRGFIELTGEVGCGKSTLCRAVLEDLGDQIKSALILNPCFNGLQLLRAIVLDFGLKAPQQDRLTLLQTLNDFLLEQAENDVTVALIIDEAQNLPTQTLEEVRMLSNLETAHQKLIQIVLSGQPELRARLNDPALRQLRQRITVRYHIAPMAAEDIGGYIGHRLDTAGAIADLKFTQGAVDHVARYSNGVPRLINALCDYALMAAFAAGSYIVTEECVARAEAQLEGRPE